MLCLAERADVRRDAQQPFRPASRASGRSQARARSGSGRLNASSVSSGRCGERCLGARARVWPSWRSRARSAKPHVARWPGGPARTPTPRSTDVANGSPPEAVDACSASAGSGLSTRARSGGRSSATTAWPRASRVLSAATRCWPARLRPSSGPIAALFRLAAGPGPPGALLPSGPTPVGVARRSARAGWRRRAACGARRRCRGRAAQGTPRGPRPAAAAGRAAGPRAGGGQRHHRRYVVQGGHHQVRRLDRLSQLVGLVPAPVTASHSALDRLSRYFISPAGTARSTRGCRSSTSSAR